MKYNLFLDDVRGPADAKWVKLPNDERWIIARSYGEFVDVIEQRGLPEFVSFDHDLTEHHYKASLLENEKLSASVDYGPEKTGFDAAKWLVNYCRSKGLKFPNYAVHSLNQAAGERIQAYISEYKS